MTLRQVFVFGTLKEGFPNFARNLGRRVPGVFATVERLPLYLVGERCSPWLIDEPGLGYQVIGQVFDVTAEALERMDALERVDQPDGYRRRTLRVGQMPLSNSTPFAVAAYLTDPDQLAASEIRDGPLDEYTLAHARQYRPRSGTPAPSDADPARAWLAEEDR